MSKTYNRIFGEKQIVNGHALRNKLNLISLRKADIEIKKELQNGK